jgi:Cys-rich repeat protein
VLALGGVAGCGDGATGGLDGSEGGDLTAGPTCDAFTCNPNGCNSTADCPTGRKCDPMSHTCVSCVEDSDCPRGQLCSPKHLCAAGCSQAHGCAGDGGVCEVDAGTCVTCLVDADCTDPTNPRCDPASHTCFPCYTHDDNCGVATYCAASTDSFACAPGCKDDSDCLSAASDGGDSDGGARSPATRCDVAKHACVECLADGDCPAGKVCSGQACVAGCTNAHGCPGKMSCCTGACVDESSDPADCGACAMACAGGSNCCDSTCSDPVTDIRNCGACGVICGAVANGVPGCAAQVCGIGSCNAGYADCKNGAADGCETNLGTDVNNCGACNMACGAVANGVPGCVVGQCGVATCNGVFRDCNKLPGDGCEADTSQDVNNCGGCGTACPVNNSCLNGACAPNCNASPQWAKVNCSNPSWDWSLDRNKAMDRVTANTKHVLATSNGNGNDKCSVLGTGWYSTAEFTESLNQCNTLMYHLGGSYTGNCGGHQNEPYRLLVLGINDCYAY